MMARILCPLILMVVVVLGFLGLMAIWRLCPKCGENRLFCLVACENENESCGRTDEELDLQEAGHGH